MVLDDVELSQCIACELAYGSIDCEQCPLYEGTSEEMLKNGS